MLRERRPTDGRTNGRTDQPTKQLKSGFSLNTRLENEICKKKKKQAQEK